MKIVIGNDHAGVEFKKIMLNYLMEQGHEIINVGVDVVESVDYPDIAREVSEIILRGEAQFGILICGTGIGISIAANRNEGIRAALCNNEFTAKLSRQHNDANIIALGARVMGDELAKACIDTFLNTEFEGGRHSNRVNKIDSNKITC